MTSDLGFLLAILTAISWSAYALIARTLIVKSDRPLAFAVLVNIFASLFALLVLAVEGGTFIGITAIVLAATFISTVFSGIFESLQIFVRKMLEASRSTVLSQLTPIVTLVAAVIVLGEHLTMLKVAGTSLIVGGNLIAAYRHGGALSRRAVFFALGAAAALGCVYVADKFASSHYPIGFYMVFSYFLPALYIFLFVMPAGRLNQIISEFRYTTWRLPVLALTGIFGYYLLLKTFLLAEASMVVPIVYSSTVFTVLGGIIILKERLNIPQKLTGAIFVVIGVILLK